MVYRDVQDELLRERDVEISQPAMTAKAAYQMLIAINLTQNTCHMVKYQRFSVKTSEPEDRFDNLLEFELETVHYRHDGRRLCGGYKEGLSIRLPGL